MKKLHRSNPRRILAPFICTNSISGCDRAEVVHQAIIEWMEMNLEFIGFVRDVESEIAHWYDPGALQEFCDCNWLARRRHVLSPVGLIPGFITPAGPMGVIIYQHKPASDDRPWELCFTLVDNQTPQGQRNPLEGGEATFLAFLNMPGQLFLTDS